MPRPEGVEIKRSYQIRELTKAINGPRKTGMSGRTESLLNVPKKAPGRIFPVSERRSVKKGRQKNVQGGEGEGGEGKKRDVLSHQLYSSRAGAWERPKSKSR
jgi:hypothetical protein